MQFWDSSAIVPLFAIEDFSSPARTLLRSDGHMVVWWGARVECLSAVVRRSRESSAGHAEMLAGRRALDLLSQGWTEIEPNVALRARAEHVLTIYRLRAADSLQLAAALAWADGYSTDRRFVCLDARLR